MSRMVNRPGRAGRSGALSTFQNQSNMLGVLSRIKVDMPPSSRASRGWRRRAGSSRYSFRSNVSQDSSKGVSSSFVLCCLLPVSPSFSLSPSLSVCLSVCLSVSVSVSLSLSLSLSLVCRV